MHLIGRYEKVILAGMDGLGPPMILDSGRAQARPRLLSYRVGDWVSNGRMWLPAIRGGAVDWGHLNIRLLVSPAWSISQTMNTVALDSAYSFGASGDAYALRLGPFPFALALRAVHINVSSYTGTAANVNDLLIEVRNNSSGTPGSTLHDSQVHDPQSATGWRRQDGFSFTLPADTICWIIVADPDGNGTDFAVMRARYTGASGGRNTNQSYRDTTDGWQTGTNQFHISSIVAEFSDGRVAGNPITADATSTSGTYERGWLLIGGFGGRFKLHGMTAGNAFGPGTFGSVKVYPEGENPNGTTLGAGTHVLLGEDSDSHLGVTFDTPLSIAQEITLRIVYDYLVARVAPGKASIGAGAHPSLRRSLWGGGNYTWTEESGGVWVDDLDAQPRDTNLLLSGLEAVEAPPPGARFMPQRWG